MRLPPGVPVVTPSVLVMARFAWGERVSVSVALLFVRSGSVVPAGTATAAVLTNDPLAEELIVASTVKMKEPPTGRFTEASILPVPEAGPAPFPAPAPVQLAVSAAGKTSVTVAPVTGLGPKFLMVMVYATLLPGVALVTPSVTVTARSATGETTTGALVPEIPGAEVSAAVIVWLPPVANVTGSVFVPWVSTVSEGWVAKASVLVNPTVPA